MAKLVKTMSLIVAATASVAVCAAPSMAQGFKIDQRKLDKTTFYSAPRQMQILDERPIIKDFREAPAAQQQIELPPGPQGYGGGGGGGAGALQGGGPGGGAGGAPMQMGGPVVQPRTSNGMVPSAGALPRSGFGPSNIPARGILPKGPLADGTNTNRLMGKMMTPPKAQGASAGPARGMAPTKGPTNGNYSGPAVSSYSGGYGNGSGAGFGGASSRTDTSVRGSLLRKN